MADRFISKSISIGKINIAYLGRLDPSKGVQDLVAAFKSYIDKTPDSKLILYIAGAGILESAILKSIQGYPAIIFKGKLAYQQIDEYLSSSHYTIIPSKFDNFCMVGLESMMNQTPLLISNTVGLSEYLVDGKECFKFDSNVDSMVEVFKRVEHNLDLPTMSLNARATFKAHFSLDIYCEKMAQLV